MGREVTIGLYGFSKGLSGFHILHGRIIWSFPPKEFVAAASSVKISPPDIFVVRDELLMERFKGHELYLRQSRVKVGLFQEV